MEAFRGTWFHTLDVKDKKETVVLRGFRDNNGRLAFTYVRQHFSFEPIFTECSFHRNEIQIKFKLTSYSKGYDSEHTVRYVLSEADGVLHGQLFQSWTDPQEVTLMPVTKDTFSDREFLRQ